MSTPLRVLLVEDSPDDADLVVRSLRCAGFDPEWQRVMTAEDFCSHLRPDLDLILSDYHLPAFSVEEALRLLQAEGLDVPLIVVSGALGDERAVALLQQGAADYLLKDRLARLGHAVRQTLEQRRLQAQQQKDQEALRSIQEILTSLLDHAPAPIHVTTTDGRYRLVNRAWEQIFQMRREEVIGRLRQEVMPAERAERLNAITRRVASTGEAEIREEMLMAGEETHIFHAVKFPLRGADGTVEAVGGISIDITENRKVAEELRYAMADARCLLWYGEIEVLPTGPLAWKLTFPDEEAAQRLLPLPVAPGERYEHALWLSRLPEDRQRTDTFASQEVRAGRSYSQEYRCRRIDGEIRWIAEDVHIKSVGPGRWHAVGVCTDITERKRAELLSAAFSDLGARLSAAKTPLEAGRIIVDAAQTLLGWDACSFELYSETTENAKSILIMDTIDGRRVDVPPVYEKDDTGPPTPIMQRVLRGGALLIVRDTPTAAPSSPGDAALPPLISFGDKGRPSACLMFVPARYDNRVVGILSIQSYTPQAYNEESLALLQALADHCGGALERIQAEAALEQQAKELARSNADLEQFAYVASHDLQEPLRMVASFTQLLARRYRGKMDDDADEFIRYAVDGTVRMQALIKDLLEYSRVATRGKELEPTDCHQVLRVTLSNLKTTIEESGAILTHDSLPTVLADGSQLVQVFQNLIGNALKFRGERPPQIHIGAVRQGSEWEFSIRDNGIGIEEQYAERIFVIFQRLHIRDQYPGTGIGLAICKKIIERHKGRIWLESKPGEGTTFFFTLPAC